MFSCLGGFHYIILVYFPLHNVALNIEAVLQAVSFQRQKFSTSGLLQSVLQPDTLSNNGEGCRADATKITGTMCRDGSVQAIKRLFK